MSGLAIPGPCLVLFITLTEQHLDQWIQSSPSDSLAIWNGQRNDPSQDAHLADAQLPKYVFVRARDGVHMTFAGRASVRQVRGRAPGVPPLYHLDIECGLPGGRVEMVEPAVPERGNGRYHRVACAWLGVRDVAQLNQAYSRGVYYFQN